MPELTGDPNQHPIIEFAEGISGHCLCGSIHVTIHDKELFTKRRGHLCHCANCRKVAGSYVASNLIIDEDKVTIEDRDGTLKEFVDKGTMSGEPLGRFFCGTCGNPIKSVVPARKGKVIIKMGMFPRIPAPECETFALHRHDWQGVHQGVDQYKIRIFDEKLEPFNVT
ncbi:putative glutathione-dependent formaldehyde-activating protein [Botryosphaeria dothidea]|uniref:Glutathione-dependent formaldehyde-activating protein n=1 Tax=Botryosphaeria dothidea TaxID=55169 RepID=A0A8H4NA90_9PEZI|nr:putative glutathione-dependent formaldehyde-activating protein [Botryosphaeria dothidea]